MLYNLHALEDERFEVPLDQRDSVPVADRHKGRQPPTRDVSSTPNRREGGGFSFFFLGGGGCSRS